MRTYPNPHKAVPYDSTVWARKETSATARLQGLSSGARGRCSNHAEFPAIIMQKHGRVYHAYCAHCVAVGKRIDAEIQERMKTEVSRTTQEDVSRRTAPNYHVLYREAIAQ